MLQHIPCVFHSKRCFLTTARIATPTTHPPQILNHDEVPQQRSRNSSNRPGTPPPHENPGRASSGRSSGVVSMSMSVRRVFKWSFWGVGRWILQAVLPWQIWQPVGGRGLPRVQEFKVPGALIGTPKACEPTTQSSPRLGLRV